ncbi:guanylate kinase family protein [Cryptosporidium serpentis]
MNKTLLVVCGPSGVGKSTLIEYLIKKYPNKFKFSISYTTRKPRGHEVNGVEYYFCSKEEMEQLILQDQLIEHANVHGNIYGTSITTIENIVNEGKYCILDIDLQGLKQIQSSSYFNKANYIGILPPSYEALEARLIERKTDNEESIKKRLNNSITEIESIKNTPRINLVINDDFKTASIDFVNIVKSFWEDLD